MAATGIPRIDQLFIGGAGAPIAANDPDPEAVGIVQDFLIGHGLSGLPGLLSQARGTFGPRTTEAVQTFQQSQGLSQTAAVDQPTLQALVNVPASKPLASRGYLTLALDIAFTGSARLLSLTAQFEGAGFFGAFNANTDRAGLSFGLIQWAQKPGRLHELLQAFNAAAPAQFVQILGDGNPALAQGLIAHAAKPNGGIDGTGATTDPQFDLIQEPWRSRFHRAALSRELQRVQIGAAAAAFGASQRRIQAYAPDIRSERGIAFMLDLANQHGDGGAKSIFLKIQQPGLSEAQLLVALRDESVARVEAQFGSGDVVTSTRNRREAFRTTPLLSDQPPAVEAGT